MQATASETCHRTDPWVDTVRVKKTRQDKSLAWIDEFEAVADVRLDFNACP